MADTLFPPFPKPGPKRSGVMIAREGYKHIIRFLLLGSIFLAIPFTFFRILGGILFVLGIFSAFFFRDPEREPVVDPSFILAAGDGRIMEVVEEERADLGGKVSVVRIFLSIFNVHIQRSPIAGKVTRVEYRKGKFLDARNPRACFDNECNSVWIENEHCKLVVKQIAGFIARRIVCKVRVGQELALGERIGLIQFGSQVDLYLTKDVEVCVSAGDIMTGGVSPVGFVKKSAGGKPG